MLQAVRLSRNFISHIGIEALAETGEWHANDDGESKMQVKCTMCSTAVFYRKRSVRKLACLKCGEMTYRPIHYLHEVEAQVSVRRSYPPSCARGGAQRRA